MPVFYLLIYLDHIHILLAIHSFNSLCPLTHFTQTTNLFNLLS